MKSRIILILVLLMSSMALTSCDQLDTELKTHQKFETPHVLWDKSEKAYVVQWSLSSTVYVNTYQFSVKRIPDQDQVTVEKR